MREMLWSPFVLEAMCDEGEATPWGWQASDATERLGLCPSCGLRAVKRTVGGTSCSQCGWRLPERKDLVEYDQERYTALIKTAHHLGVVCTRHGHEERLLKMLAERKFEAAATIWPGYLVVGREKDLKSVSWRWLGDEGHFVGVIHDRDGWLQAEWLQRATCG